MLIKFSVSILRIQPVICHSISTTPNESTLSEQLLCKAKLLGNKLKSKRKFCCDPGRAQTGEPHIGNEKHGLTGARSVSPTSGRGLVWHGVHHRSGPWYRYFYPADLLITQLHKKIVPYGFWSADHESEGLLIALSLVFT